MSTEEQKLTELSLLVDQLSTFVAQDGGELVLLGANTETGVVEVQLRGACSSCAISTSTLSGGVERILLERLSWVKEVRSGVDEEYDFEESMSMGAGAYVPMSRSAVTVRHRD
jgi:Fe-S cluster biogenesis protein NfuA